MAQGLNRVMLLGNLGADPDLRFTGGGEAILKLRLATSESYMDRDKRRQERTEWHSVVVWGKRAEALAKILAKGSRIFIEGTLRTSSFEVDGQKRYRTEVIAREVILTGGGGVEHRERAQSPAGGSDEYGSAEDFDDEDIPF